MTTKQKQAGRRLGIALKELIEQGLDPTQATIAALTATPDPGPARDAVLAELRSTNKE